MFLASMLHMLLREGKESLFRSKINKACPATGLALVGSAYCCLLPACILIYVSTLALARRISKTHPATNCGFALSACCFFWPIFPERPKIQLKILRLSLGYCLLDFWDVLFSMAFELGVLPVLPCPGLWPMGRRTFLISDPRSTPGSL